MTQQARGPLLLLGLLGGLCLTPPTLMAQEPGPQHEASRTHPAPGREALELGGLLQVWFIHDPEASGARQTFRIRRTKIWSKGKMTPRLTWKVQVDLAKTLALHTTTTQINGTSVVQDVSVNTSSRILQDAYVRVAAFPHHHHHLDLGQLKTPVTEEGRRSSSLLDTVERSLIGRTYGAKRDIGAQITGTFPWLEYRLGLFNGEGSNQTDRNDQKDVAALLTIKPLRGLEVGGLIYRGTTGETGAAKHRDGAELRYQRGDLSVKAEAIWAQDDTTRSRGWYAQIGYAALQPLHGVVRYEGFDPDQSMSDDQEFDLTVGVMYLLRGSRTKVQLNYVNKVLQMARPEATTNQLLAAIQVVF